MSNLGTSLNQLQQLYQQLELQTNILIQSLQELRLLNESLSAASTRQLPHQASTSFSVSVPVIASAPPPASTSAPPPASTSAPPPPPPPPLAGQIRLPPQPSAQQGNLLNAIQNRDTIQLRHHVAVQNVPESNDASFGNIASLAVSRMSRLKVAPKHEVLTIEQKIKDLQEKIPKSSGKNKEVFTRELQQLQQQLQTEKERDRFNSGKTQKKYLKYKNKYLKLKMLKK